nr:peptidylprolyl isomerase [Sedimentibacter sp.]
MNKFRNLVSLTLVFCMALAITACSKNDEGKSDLINQEGVLAVVNGKTITQKDFDETLASYKKMVETQYGEGAWDTQMPNGKTFGDYYKDEAIMENMILEQLLIDAAEKEGFSMTDEELKKELDVYKGYFKTDEEYQTFLKTNEMTEDYLTEAIKKEYVINQYLQKNVESVVPTDDELKKIYEDTKMGQQVRASHILVNTEEEANAVIDRLNKGEAFEDVAKDVSVDPSKDNGGDLDFFSYGDMVKEFSDAAFSMDIGEVSGAVKSQFGYHIIKVTDKKTDDTVTFDNSKDSLIETYKTNKYNELIENLKSNATIERK